LKTLLVEPFGGLAGDMFLAALCDLEHTSFDLARLERFARSLVPESLQLVLEEVQRSGIRAKVLRVVTPESAAPPRRHLKDLLSLLEKSELSSAAKADAARVLTRLGRAEARIHGVPLERVHFHEIGAVDTLVDVAGAVHALECLGIERTLATAPYLGGGTVVCEHGELPVPAPATAALLHGRRVRYGPGGERCTPTAAALLCELFPEHAELEEDGRIEAIGYGAGTREPSAGPPNLVRVTLLHGSAKAGLPQRRRRTRAEAWAMECNLDDVSGEELGFLMGELRAEGALEVWSVPVQMKKDRPGAIVSLLCRGERREPLEELLFTHSPTLGVRWSRVERSECARQEVCVQVRVRGEDEEVRVKVRGSGDSPGPLDISPEYDDLARIAKKTGRPLREIEAQAIALVRERYD